MSFNRELVGWVPGGGSAGPGGIQGTAYQGAVLPSGGPLQRQSATEGFVQPDTGNISGDLLTQAAQTLVDMGGGRGRRLRVAVGTQTDGESGLPDLQYDTGMLRELSGGSSDPVATQLAERDVDDLWRYRRVDTGFSSDEDSAEYLPWGF